jgi:hypothetical protein
MKPFTIAVFLLILAVTASLVDAARRPNLLKADPDARKSKKSTGMLHFFE